MTWDFDKKEREKESIQCTQFSTYAAKQPPRQLIQDLQQNLQGSWPKIQCKKRKKEKKEKQQTKKEEEQIHIRSSLLKIYIYKSMSQKMGNSVQQKEIELIQPKLFFKKKKIHLNQLKNKGLRNKAGQQRAVWRNSRKSWGRENSLPFNLQVLQNFVNTS